jgi:hypothetical protein
LLKVVSRNNEASFGGMGQSFGEIGNVSRLVIRVAVNKFFTVANLNRMLSEACDVSRILTNL